MKDKRAVVVVWELSSMLARLPKVVELMSSEELTTLVENIKKDIQLLLENLKGVPLVFFARFSSFAIYESNLFETTKIESIAYELNEFLDSNAKVNLIYFAMDKAFAEIGLRDSLDLRLYRSSRSLFTFKFLKYFSGFVSQYIFALEGKSKKVLVLDCDNTLWGGILGEDGLNVWKCQHLRLRVPF